MRRIGNDPSLLHWVGRPRSRIAVYVIAFAAVLIATALRLALDVIAPDAAPFAFHFLAVLVAAAAGGFGPGFAATVLAALTTWPLFVSRSVSITVDSFSIVDPSLSALIRPSALVNVAAFVAIGLAMSAAGAALRSAIAKRKHAQEALRTLQESERRLHAIADALPQLVWSTLPDGTYDYYNQQCLDFAGSPPEVGFGGGWSKLLHENDRKRTRETWRRSLETGKPFEIEYRFRDATGRYRWFLGRAVPVINGDGQVERWLGTSTDISDIVTARETLVHGKQEQERIVAERTTELAATNARLRAEIEERSHAEERLRRAHKMEAVGQLTGGLAHDFNNLLTVVIGSIEAIQRRLGEKADPAIRGYTDSAMHGARRAAALTKRLLAFARGQPLEPKAVDVNGLLSGMPELLARTLGETTTLETVLANGIWPTEVDPSQLESALLNLAVNARDAMPNGGKLTIETANADLSNADAASRADVTAGQYVMLSVRDTGAGMTKETLTRVFEPFFTTKPAGQGTGLGLSQIYGFVQQSGGHINIDSKLGMGTTVKIYLPRLTGVPAELAGELPPKAPPAQEQDTVLVVEDDEDVRRYAVNMLRELGYGVVEAADGSAALRLLETNPDIRFLFTDIGLPGDYNGRQLADEALRRRPYLKVLYTTGYAREAVMRRGRLDPKRELILKPFTFDQFAARVRKIFDVAGKGHILLVEDEALVASVAAEALRELGFRVTEVANAAEAKERFKADNGKLSVAIIDIGLPDQPGDELASELRALRPDLPVIIATGQGDKALLKKLKGKERLAVLGKPYDTTSLRAALSEVGLG